MKKPDKDEQTVKTLGMDGLFKELTWGGMAITNIFGLPPIVGDPVQQEYQMPLQRRVDRLYRLEDGTLLNIEHQSQLRDTEDLANRMAVYHLLVRSKNPGTLIRQAVIYAPVNRSDSSRVPDRVEVGTLDADGHGLKFSAPVRDLRTVEISMFEASGALDDLMLGVLAVGTSVPGYLGKVVARVKSLRGEQHFLAVEKLFAVIAMINTQLTPEINGEIDMWMDEVKDRPFVKHLVEVAGKGRLQQERAEGRKLVCVEMIYDHAVGLGLSPNEDLIDRLMETADEDQLKAMVKDLAHLEDIDAFLAEHGVSILTPKF